MSLFTEYYDTIWGDIADEKFLSDILAQYEKGLMVDLGCASGRVLKIGLKADWSVCGIDFDRDMLAEARKELDALPGCERSTLIESDFCDFNLPAPARVIVSMANTYTLVMDKEARRKLFKSVYRNLEKNGTFAVYFISSASFLTGVKERTFNVDKGTLVYKAWTDDDHEKMIRTIYVEISLGEDKESLVFPTKMIPNEEIEEFAAESGLTIVSKAGGLENQPMTPEAPYQVYILKKKEVR